MKAPRCQSMRVIVALNLRQALEAKRRGWPRTRRHHLETAWAVRSEIRALLATAAKGKEAA
jgi:hypothetical protein